MSTYIVTARKWRPMRFEDVVGQEHVTTTLRNAIETGRLAHAYIFSGPRGVGKTTTARLLAKAVNCLHPDHANPDNTCELCVEVNEGKSFDVLEIDGASNRGVEEIRNLREAVRYAPARGSRRVYIIDEVHMLTKEAFNALLKTLEEPPPHVLFIFATTELHKLPATILSRCQRFDFRRIPTERIRNNLAAIAAAEHLSLDEESLMMIARKGDGSLRDAQSTFDMVIALCGTTVTHDQILQALNVVDQEMYFRVTDCIKDRDTAGILRLVEEIVNRGYDLKEFVGGLVEHFRNLMVVRATESTASVEVADVYRKRYAEVAGAFTLADLLRFQRLVAATDAAFRWVTQPRFKLEADMILLATMPSASDVGTVLREIDEVRKKLDAPQPTPPAVASPSGFRTAPATHGTGDRPRPPLNVRRAPGAPASTPLQPQPATQPNGKAISEGEVRSRWKEFAELVRQRHISLGTVIDVVAVLGVEGNVIRVHCPGQFQADTITRNKERLSDVLEETFHVRARLQPVVDAEAQTPEAKTHAEDEHPVIAAMKRELGAEPI